VLPHLIELCVRRRLAVLIVALGIAAWGIHAYLDTAIEAFPDVTNIRVNVIAQMPGQAPEEIERQVTVPLERVLNGVPGEIAMRSESLFGLSLIWLVFADDADGFRSRNLVIERLTEADLPEGVTPRLAPDDTPLGEIYQYRLKSDTRRQRCVPSRSGTCPACCARSQGWRTSSTSEATWRKCTSWSIRRASSPTI
jgi:heavy metal efflux system protein